MKNELKNAYLEIPEINEFYKICSEDKSLNLKNKLSGLFLPSVSDDYESSENKIMVIGRETRGWPSFYDSKGDLTDYVDRMMSFHENFIAKQLVGTNHKGRSFHNFMREVSDRTGKEGIVYSNLFCCDMNGKLPAASHHFKMIKSLSKKLLFAQIKVLQPEIILFMNGFDQSSVKTRREFFPINGPYKVCFDFKDYCEEERLTNKQLWQFNLKFEDRMIKSYRTYHPSAINKKAREAHEFLISLLPSSSKS